MSTSEEEKYPKRILEAGSVMYLSRSINHYNILTRIAALKDRIGEDVYNEIKESKVGVVVKLAELKFKLGGKHLQHLFANLLETSMPHEKWVLAAGRPIRLSLHEYSYVTGLKCREDGEDSNAGEIEDDALEKHLDMRNPLGPAWADIDSMLNLSRTFSREKKKMLGLLLVLHTGILGLHAQSRVPVKLAKLVTDPDRFDRHPWGRESFDWLITSIKKPQRRLKGLNLHGLVPALVAWAYEQIPALAKVAGTERPATIPILKWASRPTRRSDTLAVFAEAKANSKDGKVFVKHIVEYQAGDAFPKWPGEETPHVDPKVQNMLSDIEAGTLDESFWEGEEDVTVKVLSPAESADIQVALSGSKRKTADALDEVSAFENTERGVEEGVGPPVELGVAVMGMLRKISGEVSQIVTITTSTHQMVAADLEERKQLMEMRARESQAMLSRIERGEAEMVRRGEEEAVVREAHLEAMRDVVAKLTPNSGASGTSRGRGRGGRGGLLKTVREEIKKKTRSVPLA